MFDLHTHTIFSDGELIPSELARRAEVNGLTAIAFTDHADASNIEFIVPSIKKVCDELNRVRRIYCIPGVEITHCPPSMLAPIVQKARELGAKIVVVHGETIVEPVEKGTNIAAINAGVDILAHPGLISPEEVRQAAQKGVFLEISGRKGHSLCNGYVADLAKRYRANLIVNSDAHSPGDIISPEMSMKIALGAGVSKNEYRGIIKNVKKLIQKLRGI